MANRPAEGVEELAARFSNHGRWDREGPACALSLVTRSRVLDACAMPRRGAPLACGIAPGAAPAEIATRILTPRPAPGGVVGRGVLLDVPRAERREALAPNESVDPERLDACAEQLGVTIEAGDLLLVRTGALGSARRSGDWSAYLHGPAPGLGLDAAGWLYRREIALLASDTRTAEVCAAGAPAGLPLREVAYGASGVLLGVDFELDALAAACADDGNYAFLLLAPPLFAAGANPAWPVAVK